MKYGIFFAYWTKEWEVDYKKYIDKVSDLGFDILEILASSFAEKYSTDSQIMELREYAESKGIELTAGFGPPKEYNLGSGDPETVKNAIGFYADILPKLKKAGISFIGGGLNSYWPVDYSIPINKAEDWKNSVKNVKEVAKIAEDCGVVMGMEVLNRFEGYLINTCAETLEYVNEVNSPNVGIMLDTFHMNIEEDSMVDAIRLADKHLVHFHVGEQNRKVPGKGKLPWNEIGNALREINYQKAVVMEPFVLSGSGKIVEDIKVWREIVTDSSESALDEDARGALLFLKHTFGA